MSPTPIRLRSPVPPADRLLTFIPHRLRRDVRAKPTRDVQFARNRTRPAALAAWRWNSTLRLPAAQGSVATANLDEGFAAVNWARCVGSVRARAGMERKICLALMERSSLARAGRFQKNCRKRRAHPCCRQSVQHQLPHCHEPTRPDVPPEPVFSP